MPLSFHQPYPQIVLTWPVYRAYARVRKSGATITYQRQSSTQGRFTVLHDVIIEGSGDEVLQAANRLHRLLAPKTTT